VQETRTITSPQVLDIREGSGGERSEEAVGGGEGGLSESHVSGLGHMRTKAKKNC